MNHYGANRQIVLCAFLILVYICFFNCSVDGRYGVRLDDSISCGLTIINRNQSIVTCRAEAIVSDPDLIPSISTSVHMGEATITSGEQELWGAGGQLDNFGTLDWYDFEVKQPVMSLRIEITGFRETPYVIIGWPQAYSPDLEADDFGLIYTMADGKYNPATEYTKYWIDEQSKYLPDGMRFGSGAHFVVTINPDATVDIALSPETIERLTPIN